MRPQPADPKNQVLIFLLEEEFLQQALIYGYLIRRTGQIPQMTPYT
jgi:hypothetical protein